jgi:hypothetical protein
MKKTTFAFSILVLCAWISGCASARNADAPELYFLDKAEAAEAILDDSMEPYFDKLLPLEMSAKTGVEITGSTLAEMREEFKRRYTTNVGEFTETEKEILTSYINRIYRVVKKEFPAFAEIPWRFAKITERVEGGLPHTRGNTIFMPSFAIGSDSEGIFMEVLIHEQFHVYERSHKEVVDAFCTEVLGYEKVKEIQSCKWLDDRQIVDPDATDLKWIFSEKEGNVEKLYWSRVLFRCDKGLQKMQEDMWFYGIEVEEKSEGVFVVKTDSDGKPEMKDLSSIKEFHDKAVPLQVWEIYHPYEYAAICFTCVAGLEFINSDDNLPREKKDQLIERFGPSRKWLKEHMAK